MLCESTRRPENEVDEPPESERGRWTPGRRSAPRRACAVAGGVDRHSRTSPPGCGGSMYRLRTSALGGRRTEEPARVGCAPRATERGGSSSRERSRDDGPTSLRKTGALGGRRGAEPAGDEGALRTAGRGVCRGRVRSAGDGARRLRRSGAPGRRRVDEPAGPSALGERRFDNSPGLQCARRKAERGGLRGRGRSADAGAGRRSVPSADSEVGWRRPLRCGAVHRRGDRGLSSLRVRSVDRGVENPFRLSALRRQGCRRAPARAHSVEQGVEEPSRLSPLRQHGSRGPLAPESAPRAGGSKSPRP